MLNPSYWYVGRGHRAGRGFILAMRRAPPCDAVHIDEIIFRFAEAEAHDSNIDPREGKVIREFIGEAAFCDWRREWHWADVGPGFCQSGLQCYARRYKKQR